MTDQQTDTQQTRQPAELSHEQLDAVSGGPLECALWYTDGIVASRQPHRRTIPILDTLGDGETGGV